MKDMEAAQAMGDPAEAAQRVAMLGMAQMAQQEQALMGGDPSIQLGTMELQHRSKEHEDKTVIDVAQIALKSRELDIREMEAVGSGAVKGLELKQSDIADRRQLGAHLVDVASKLAIAERKADIDEKKVQAQKTKNSATRKPNGGNNGN
jgi:hypothetical protein